MFGKYLIAKNESIFCAYKNSDDYFLHQYVGISTTLTSLAALKLNMSGSLFAPRAKKCRAFACVHLRNDTSMYSHICEKREHYWRQHTRIFFAHRSSSAHSEICRERASCCAHNVTIITHYFLSLVDGRRNREWVVVCRMCLWGSLCLRVSVFTRDHPRETIFYDALPPHSGTAPTYRHI